MKLIKEKMVRHLKEKEVSYLHHLVCALGYCINISIALLALVVHSFLPFLFEETASSKLNNVLEKMNK